MRSGFVGSTGGPSSSSPSSGSASFGDLLVARPSFGQHRPQRLVEIGRALAMLGRQRDRLAEAQFVGVEHAAAPGGAFRLVGDEQDRLVDAPQRIGEMPVGRGHTGPRIDEEQDRVASRKRRFRLRAHAAGERGRIALLQSRRVDNGEDEIAEMRLALAAIAGDAGLIVDKRELAADEPVEQRRLADVGAADDGDLRRHDFGFGPCAATRPSSVSAICRSDCEASASPNTWSSHLPAPA